MPNRDEKEHHRRLKREAQSRTALVERVLGDEDPYCLLAMGAPSDQFHPQAALIAARWKEGMPLEALATVIEEVWTGDFGPFSSAEATATRHWAHAIAERLIATAERGV